ncbi:glucose PTS transporter subunit EIIB, partial [Clostridium perfringens]
MSLIWLLPLVFAVYYFVFKFAIVKFNLKTPGRDTDSEVKLMSKKEYNNIKKGEEETESTVSEETLEVRIIEALGGAGNIETVTCCATRLRVTVKDDSLIITDQDWKNNLEALGVVHGKNSIQVIYGVRVGNITTAVKDIL